ncbi:MAG: 4-hydroxy-tetrahydrodipicolinate reductase [Candidatus Sumerlaeota bacterium]|nr:4-hydroxy-tetrahydrodipicolinate reductase [Candidatus Sumerlaeota bacterium]
MPASTHLLLSGLPGKMAREVVAVAVEEQKGRYSFVSEALSGPGCPVSDNVAGQAFTLLDPDARATMAVPPYTLAVDFTQPDAALANVAFYAEKGIPFVMGTTGFDMEKARALVRDSGICAVIAPNMAIPIILMQEAVAHLAANFPGAMAGHGISITESHQSGKKDTSGTAKALAADFAKLGLPAAVDKITMLRDPERQRAEMNVPEEHLGGHAYHSYEITSAGGDVRLGLSHCVNGRRVYARGTLQAVDFLARRIAAREKGKVFTMQDVLKDMG